MYLIDTNIVSEWRKGERADEGVRRFVSEANDRGDALFLSVVTIGELRRGIDALRLRNDAPQAARLERWYDGLIHAFRDQILGVDMETAQIWGRLRALDPHNSLDKLIAATAVLYELTVVTRNEKDFAGVGVKVLNPYDEGRGA